MFSKLLYTDHTDHSHSPSISHSPSLYFSMHLYLHPYIIHSPLQLDLPPTTKSCTQSYLCPDLSHSPLSLYHRNPTLHYSHFSYRPHVLYKDMPIVILLKALGVETDQEIVQMVGNEPMIHIALGPCIEECHRAHVFTQKQVVVKIIGVAKM